MSGEALQSGELTIEPGRDTDGTLVLVWRGRSTDPQPARVIVPYVTLWLEKALHQKAALRLELAPLEDMSSSTITAIVEIIREASSRQTPVTLSYDASKGWQKLGFEALRVFATPGGVLSLVEAEGAEGES
jgi:hypothetical protein